MFKKIIAITILVLVMLPTAPVTSEEVTDAVSSGPISITIPSRAKSVHVFETTGYTWTGDRTATGTWPQKGTVAVDPQVIPLGTHLWIEGYGEAVAEDTGGLIQGQIIDLYFETEAQCWEWGRRKVRVVYEHG